MIDTLLDLSLGHHRGLLARDTVLVDETDRHDASRVLICLRHALRDGRTTVDGRVRSVSELLQSNAGYCNEWNCQS